AKYRSVLRSDDVDIETGDGVQPAAYRLVGTHVTTMETFDIGQMGAEIIDKGVVIVHRHHGGTNVAAEQYPGYRVVDVDLTFRMQEMRRHDEQLEIASRFPGHALIEIGRAHV